MAKATWVLDLQHSHFEFSVKHMMISTVKGSFDKADATIELDPEDLTTASFRVSIDVASINTREKDRDAHLRSADFFDVEKYPTIEFVSKRVVPKGGNEYTLVGDLTIHGVTKEIELALTFEGQGKDPWGNERVGFSAEGKLNRKDFGLVWNAALETGGVLVGEQVKLSIQVEAIKQN